MAPVLTSPLKIAYTNRVFHFGMIGLLIGCDDVERLMKSNQ